MTTSADSGPKKMVVFRLRKTTLEGKTHNLVSIIWERTWVSRILAEYKAKYVAQGWTVDEAFIVDEVLQEFGEMPA